MCKCLKHTVQVNTVKLLHYISVYDIQTLTLFESFISLSKMLIFGKDIIVILFSFVVSKL